MQVAAAALRGTGAKKIDRCVLQHPVIVKIQKIKYCSGKKKKKHKNNRENPI